MSFQTKTVFELWGEGSGELLKGRKRMYIERQLAVYLRIARLTTSPLLPEWSGKCNKTQEYSMQEAI